MHEIVTLFKKGVPRQKKVYQKSVLTASGLKNAYFIKNYRIFYQKQK